MIRAALAFASRWMSSSVDNAMFAQHGLLRLRALSGHRVSSASRSSQKISPGYTQNLFCTFRRCITLSRASFADGNIEVGTLHSTKERNQDVRVPMRYSCSKFHF
jgi:hypothetical protein